MLCWFVPHSSNRSVGCFADATERPGAQEALERRQSWKSQRFWRLWQQRRQQVRGSWIRRRGRGSRASWWPPGVLTTPAAGVAQSRFTPRRSRWPKFCVPNRRFRGTKQRHRSATWLRHWFSTGKYQFLICSVDIICLTAFCKSQEINRVKIQNDEFVV